MFWKLWALSLGGLMLLGGLISLVAVGVEHFSKSDSFCPESFDSEKLVERTNLGDRTAPYAGPGPHSVAIYSALQVEQIVEMTQSIAERQGLPVSWGAKMTDDKPDAVQLLLCIYDRADVEHPESEGTPVGTCRYWPPGEYTGDGQPVQARAAPVKYLLYEAATKRLLTSFTLTAKKFTEADCPRTASFYPDESRTVWISPKAAEVTARLKPFVEASR